MFSTPVERDIVRSSGVFFSRFDYLVLFYICELWNGFEIAHLSHGSEYGVWGSEFETQNSVICRK